MGTGQKLGNNTNIRKLYNAYKGRAFITEIGLAAPGASTARGNAHQFLCDEICKEVTINCSNKTHTVGTLPKIDIFGWSRGAMNAVRLAALLKKDGCKCYKTCTYSRERCEQGKYVEHRWTESYTRRLYAHIRPIDVRFLGLIDVIERGFYNFKKDEITDNVQTAYHAYRDGNHDTTNWDTVVGSPVMVKPANAAATNFKEEDFPLSHPGMGWDISVYNAMVREAKKSGVPF